MNEFDYVIGIDPGASLSAVVSVGLDHREIRKHGQRLMTVMGHSEAESAQDRRQHRINRRRLNSRKKRTRYIDAFFKEEIEKIDPSFLSNKKQSQLHPEDRESRLHHTLFNDHHYTDRTFSKEFPTIYHLRKAIMEQPERKFDIRLIYLAIQHIIKNRGNFLYPGISESEIQTGSFNRICENLQLIAQDLDIKLPANIDFKNALLKDRKTLEELLLRVNPEQRKLMKTIVKLLYGGEVSLTDLLPEEAETVKFCFSDKDWNNTAQSIRALIKDGFIIIDNLKQVYDWRLLAGILGDHKSISEAMAAKYDAAKASKQELPALRKRKTENSLIPYQVHLIELKRILENSARHYPFLNSSTFEDNVPVKDKIVQVMTYRRPYYAGAGCLIRIEGTEKESIRPWTADKIIDFEACAEHFISTRINRCSYCPSHRVLPKNSLLYSEFIFLNLINAIKISGQYLSKVQKQSIWEALKNKGSLSVSGIAKVLRCAKDDITGIDASLKLTAKAYCDFEKILDVDSNVEFVEACIEDLTAFPDEQTILKQRISRQAMKYGTVLSLEQLDSIMQLRYAGWGQLSKEFLTQVLGEFGSIIDAMRNTTNTLQQILSSAYSYRNALDNLEKVVITGSKFSFEELLSDSRCSPADKSTVWQELKVIREHIQYIGKNPRTFYIEAARDSLHKDKGKRTTSRRKALEKKLFNFKELKEELKVISDEQLENERVYLYFLQLGKCMYSGERISISALIGDKAGNIYDVDHIYPQSKILDNSLDNKVLVKRVLNTAKAEKDLCQVNFITDEARTHWKRLLLLQLISAAKYARLTRNQPLTTHDIAGFTASQLVKTRRVTLELRRILQKLYPESKVTLVHADMISEFRRVFKLTKCRELSDKHHKDDAYLATVVGRILEAVQEKRASGISFNAQLVNTAGTGILQSPIIRRNDTIWVPDKTIRTVKKVIDCNYYHYTMRALTEKGAFYKETIATAADCKKAIMTGNSESKMPLKSKDRHFQDVAKYGGYTGIRGAYFFLVEHKKGKKLERNILSVPIRLAAALNNTEALRQYASAPQPVGLGLVEPKILISKIPMYSKVWINGFPLFLTGKGLDFTHCAQLIISDSETKYLKTVIRSTQKEDFSRVNKQDNLKFYDLLTGKFNSGLWQQRPGASKTTKTLLQGRDKFINLELPEQCKILQNILELFKDGRVDLKMIGGSSEEGRLKLTDNVMHHKSFVLEIESPAGLFSQKIDLKNFKKELD